jgi:hypothetical protein
LLLRFNEGASSTLEDGGSVTRNQAGADGGGIYLDGGSVNLADSAIVTNNSVGGNRNNCLPVDAITNCIG